MAFDEHLRNDHRWARLIVDDVTVADLQSAVAGKLSDIELVKLIGREVEKFRHLGNITAEPGSDEWRIIARALCSAELEALQRVVERDEGDFTGQPSHPALIAAAQIGDEPEPVSLKKLWADYVKARTVAGFMKDGGRQQRPVIESLRKFLKHDDAARVTKKNLLDWRDRLITTLSARTTDGIYLSTVRSLWSWAHENNRLPENVAATVRQAKPKRQRSREAGYTDAEALIVLQASRT